MARQEYDNKDGSKTVHRQTTDSERGVKQVWKHETAAQDKSTGKHESIWASRNYSTGQVREGGHGKDFKKKD